MGRRSKATRSRLQNLGEASKSQRTRVDDDPSHDLEELMTLRGHICDFYPKYHCELNFIEQYWGTAKFRYRSTPKTSDINEMERNVIACLEEIPQLQILLDS
jgi:hypothetical protein